MGMIVGFFVFSMVFIFLYLLEFYGLVYDEMVWDFLKVVDGMIFNVRLLVYFVLL